MTAREPKPAMLPSGITPEAGGTPDPVPARDVPLSGAAGVSLASAAHRLRHVFLRDMILPARIGVYPHERTEPQRLRVNIDLAVAEDQSPPPADPMTVAQELARIVDYAQIANRVRAIVAERHVRLVETLAERLAEACLADARVRLARVRVEKLDVFPDAASAGIEIERDQRDLSTS